MDLHAIETVLRPRTRDEIGPCRPGDAFLAGGSWLFSEPQWNLTRLIDLTALGWPSIEVDEGGLTLAATCTFAQLERLDFPPAWRAAPLIRSCCHALLGSFKVWNVATIGGNLCTALPAGPMTSLATALDATCTIWTVDGCDRRIPALDFVLGPQSTALAPGEILRDIRLPAEALRRRSAFRRASLSPNGRSAALVIGTLGAHDLAVAVTAATRRPVKLRLPASASAETLATALAAAIPPGLWYDDVHGDPEWRAHVTGLLAEEVRSELVETGAAR